MCVCVHLGVGKCHDDERNNKLHDGSDGAVDLTIRIVRPAISNKEKYINFSLVLTHPDWFNYLVPCKYKVHCFITFQVNNLRIILFCLLVNPNAIDSKSIQYRIRRGTDQLSSQ